MAIMLLSGPVDPVDDDFAFLVGFQERVSPQVDQASSGATVVAQVKAWTFTCREEDGPERFCPLSSLERSPGLVPP